MISSFNFSVVLIPFSPLKITAFSLQSVIDDPIGTDGALAGLF